MAVRLGRDVPGVLEAAVRHEWLVVDGLGGYAMGTVAGVLTRAYHGLLVAAVAPPTGRVVAVAGMTETLTTPAGRVVHLDAHEWSDGAIDPRGFELIDCFGLEGTRPVWRYSVDGAVLEKRIWMLRGRPATFVTYRLVRAPLDGAPVHLELRPLCTWRDHHAVATASEPPEVVASGPGLRVRFAGGRLVHVRADRGDTEAGGDWYRGFRLRAEAARGLPAVQDLFAAGRLGARLGVGETLTVTMSIDEPVEPAQAGASLAGERAREVDLVGRAALGDGDPGWVRQLVLAADQFAVARGDGGTVIAGYPWFGDWGRDTFIALPGLSLVTGRPELAAAWLRTFARFVDAGMLPNRFPDAGETPEYNTVDATLWYVEALAAYVEATGDEGIVDELWPVLEEIVGRHLEGTRHGIGVDPADGLLRCGEAGVQLTWMDAIVDGWVVTPRAGKPVEVNALWHSALRHLAGWARTRSTAHDHAALADRVAAAFDRYWNPQRSYLFDVLDGPDGNDAVIRPNAVIAAGVAHTPLRLQQLVAVVALAERELLCALGLRSLAGGEPGYAPRYAGDRHARDAAYHQGTVWPWLLGCFVVAHLRARGDAGAARSIVETLAGHVGDAGVGSVSEVADAEPPHTPGGCPWQAWSVAEALRAWRMSSRAPVDSRRPVPPEPPG